MEREQYDERIDGCQSISDPVNHNLTASVGRVAIGECSAATRWLGVAPDFPMIDM